MSGSRAASALIDELIDELGDRRDGGTADEDAFRTLVRAAVAVARSKPA